MYIAYVDESGDNGAKPRSSRTFVLACILFNAETWPNRFDRMIAFRRHLRGRYRLPVRAEIKANYLLRNGGPFRGLGLGEHARYGIYRQCMRLHSKLGFATFAVVVDKLTYGRRYPGRKPDDVAWETLLQRLERFADDLGETILIIHD